MLVDSHCHLASRRFADDLDDVVERAAAAGVEKIVAVATDLEDSAETVALSERFPGLVFASVGVHPCDVTGTVDDPGWIGRLRDLAAAPGVVAVGETGTDHFHPPPDGWGTGDYHSLQDRCFRAQLELAEELDLPVIVHTRDSLEATAAIVSPFAGRVRAVFHCFVDSAEAAAPLIADGHLVSFTGIATFQNAPEVQACASSVPDGSFMVETDAPFLAPVPHRGKRNEPAHVAHTAAAIASLRGASTDELVAQTGRTAHEFFKFD